MCVCVCDGSSAGLGVGGVWGISEGVRSAEGRTFRLKMNRVVNGCTRRGPFLANTLGVLGALCPCNQCGDPNPFASMQRCCIAHWSQPLAT